MRLPLFLDAASLEDVPALHSIERQSYTNPWSEQSLREAVGGVARACGVVLRCPGEALARGILGYCIFRSVADELEIYDLVVHPDRRGRGLGRMLLRQVTEIGRRRGARTALLEVRPSNSAALALYGAAGFARVGVRRDYYEAPREDAWVLRKEL